MRRRHARMRKGPTIHPHRGQFVYQRAAGGPRAGRKCSTKQNPPRALPGLPRQAEEASARGGYGGEAGRLIDPADGCYPSLMTFAFFSFNILSFCFAYSSTETPRRFGMFAFALAQPDTACAWLIVAAHGVAGLAATDREGALHTEPSKLAAFAATP